MKNNKIDSDKKRKIINDYNLSFQYYDERYKVIQSNKYKRFLEDLSFQRNILDAGCGTGLLLEYFCTKETKLKDIYPNFRYTGVDISLKMLKRFYFKLSDSGLMKFVNLVLADIENLPFREKVFDEIFSITVFQNLTDIERGLDNLIRVGNDKFAFSISILKKASEIEKFNILVKDKLGKYDYDYSPSLEDNIIWGTIIKNRR